MIVCSPPSHGMLVLRYAREAHMLSLHSAEPVCFVMLLSECTYEYLRLY